MDDLIVFLRARLDDDERVARAVSSDDWGDTDDANHYEWDDLPDTAYRHAKRHDRARVLAEVDAKRRIVDVIEDQWGAAYGEPGRFLPPDWQTVLQLLALPLAGHPDYREEWRP